MDPALDFRIVEPDELSQLREAVSGLDATQTAHGHEVDRLYDIALYSGIVVLLVLLVIIGAIVLLAIATRRADRARAEDIKRNADLIAAQEQRLTAVVEDLATQTSELQAAVDDVNAARVELRTDIGKAAETLHSAALGFGALLEHYKAVVSVIDRDGIASA